MYVFTIRKTSHNIYSVYKHIFVIYEYDLIYSNYIFDYNGEYFFTQNKNQMIHFYVQHLFFLVISHLSGRFLKAHKKTPIHTNVHAKVLNGPSIIERLITTVDAIHV